MEGKIPILIVDDTLDNIHILGDLLAKEGYEIRISTNGPDAMKAIEASPPDLILLDILMSDMDGFDVCRRLKAHPDFRSIPIIFMSALDMSDHKVTAFQLGAVDYITKPFEFGEVTARVRTHLQLSKLDELRREIGERRVVEERLHRSLREKEVLIRELFHRTRNTMQLIRSLIEIQAEGQPGNEGLQALVARTGIKIQAIALVHDMLYLNKDLSNIPAADFVRKLSELFADSHDLPSDGISLDLEVGDASFLIDTAIPLGVILSELVSNSVTHGFPEVGQVRIHLALSRKEGGDFLLVYSDEGRGLPADFDFRNSGTLGLQLIHGIGEEQMRGRIGRRGGGGVTCRFDFSDSVYEARV